jgi:KDO2-lipid IV(A) lauroyltransferase
MPKRQNRTRNKTLDLLTLLGLRIFEMFLHMFPVETNYKTARMIGDLMYYFDRRHRTRAIEHLRRSFPDWTEKRLRRVARESLRHMMYLPVEMLFTTRKVTPETWRNHIRIVNMAESLRLLLEQQTGLIFLTGHFGNWEVVGYTMAALGFPNTAVARTLDNPYLNEHVLGIRQARGMTILDKRNVSMEIPELLEHKGVACFIADQDAGRKGCFVEFFGRKASTYKSIALLAMQHRTPVVVGFGRRLARPFQFEIGIERIIQPEEWDAQDDPLTWITQEYTAALEAVVRRDPAQYLWTHRRWKHRPRGEEPGPDGVA